jgi:alpha-galactosidase
VQATSSSSATALPTGKQLRTTWRITAPDDAKKGANDLTAATLYTAPSGQDVSARFTSQAYVVVSPPSGTSYVSDLPWISATNGWGPVEKDTSNGETAAGDGNPLTIGGKVYAKGLGVHAPGDVAYYTGGKCSVFSAEVGVDDEKSAYGSVTFEVWADGKKVAGTGVLTTAMGAEQITADVSGAKTVDLVVTDAGDGTNSDHADWADAKLSC